MRQPLTIFAAPAVAACLLGGMAVETARTRAVPPGVEAYHRTALAAVDSIPTRVGHWSGRPADDDVPPGAIALLKPNVIRYWKFADTDAADPRRADKWASLLVDQCKDARDMNGHWPPNCYVNSGQELTDTIERDWAVGGLTIAGTEYHFRQQTATSSTRTAVYDFLIVPGRGIFRGMDGVRRASSDYRQRLYGAAQFQVVMDDSDLTRQDRDAIFTTLMRPCVPVIRTLLTIPKPNP